MINFGLGVTLVAISTLSVGVYIGLGFLIRPSRASAIWSLAFSFAMISSYAWAIGNALDSPVARAASSTVLLVANAFLWVGFRVHRDARHTHWQLALAFSWIAVIALVATAQLEFYALVFRIVFALAAVFSVFMMVELVRLGRALTYEGLPLGVASAGFVLFALVSVIQGFTTGGAADLELIRELNAMGSIIYLVCALLTLLLVTRQTPTSGRASTQSPFTTVASDRLLRAEADDDEWWSVLDIRLDDPNDLRDATGPAAFDRIAAQFCEDVRAVLPATADLDARTPTNIVALVPMAPGELRQVLPRLLERVADGAPDQPLAVRLSASVGWAQADEVGYRLDDLVGAAHAAAARAQREGGDRWERHTVPV